MLTESIQIEKSLEQFLSVLAIALTAGILAQELPWLRRVPYTLLLVIVGLVLGIAEIRLLDLSPGLILLIFLPPLLFEASWNLKWSALKRDLLPIGLYATVGVMITIAGIALALSQWTGMPIAIALLAGATLSATDPVAVTALCKALGAPERLRTLIEGESLFNDGTAVVAFSLLMGLALGNESVDLRQTLIQFVLVVGIGVGLGLLIGFGISYLTQRFDAPPVEQIATLVSAYGAYLLAEQLGGSGVIATVIVGLILGNFGSRIGMSPQTRITVTEFWESIALFINSILFLLIGAQAAYESLVQYLPYTVTAIAAVVITRWISVFGLTAIVNQTTSAEINLPTQTVVWWSGLRGGVAIALALSIPESLPERNLLIVVVFGVILFTLLVQGLTIQVLLEKFGLLQNEIQQRYQEILARQTALNRALQALEQMSLRPILDPELYQQSTQKVQAELNHLIAEGAALRQVEPGLTELGLAQISAELTAIEAKTYLELSRVGRVERELEPILREVLLQPKE